MINGVENVNSYQSEDLTISINESNWISELNKLMDSESNSMTVLDTNGTEVKIFSAYGQSIAFFEIDGSKIAVGWSGEDVARDIKDIIYSFFQNK